MVLAINEPMYQVCFVIKIINDLKEVGLIEGGYKVDMERLNEIIEQGEKLNFNKPSRKQIEQILSDIQSDLSQKQYPNSEGK